MKFMFSFSDKVAYFNGILAISWFILVLKFYVEVY